MSLKLVKRGAVWHIRGTVAGQRVQETTGTADRADAEERLAVRSTEIWKRRYLGERETVTFAEAALSYIEHKNPAANDRRLIERLLDHFCPGWQAPNPNSARYTRAADINQLALDRAIAAVVGSQAAPATKLRNVITPLTAILSHAARRGWCERPTFERPKQPKGKTRWLTPAEAEALLAAAGKHLRPLLLFLLGTGARMAEAIELDWRDVDLAAAKAVFRVTKTGRERAAKLPTAVVAALTAMPGRDGRVFRRPDGKPYANKERRGGGQIKKAFGGACRRAGLGAMVAGRKRDANGNPQARFKPNLTPHDLRHTWASWLYALTRDPMLVMVEGGWMGLGLVQRYAHLMPSHMIGEISRVWGARHPAVGALPGLNLVQADQIG